MKTEIKIKEVVLHILDNRVAIPVLSTKMLDLTDNLERLLIKQIQRILNDGNVQNAVFFEDSKVYECCKNLKNESQSLLEVSCLLANQLFDIMLVNKSILPADLLICLFVDNNIENIGIIKLNYKTGYSHYVLQSETEVVNTIIENRTLLPLGHKIEECSIISMGDLKIRLLKKDYEINNILIDYWSKLFMDCQTELSCSAKLNVLDKTAQKVIKKHFDDRFNKVAHMKKVLAETLEDTNNVKIEEFAQEVFEYDENVKKEYINEVQRAGIKEKLITVSGNLVRKKIKNHKIKTDNGIEINFPANFFNDKNKIEFLNNIDGTISIIIKNIGRIEKY